MARLGMLYALTDEELSELKKQDTENIYSYMLEEIEEKLFGSPRACELDKAWEGIHYCLNVGEWIDDNTPASMVIYGGELLTDDEDYDVIILKEPERVQNICKYFESVGGIEKVIRENFEKIPEDDYGLPKDEDNLNYLVGWSSEVESFYKEAQKNVHNVIFSVDL